MSDVQRPTMGNSILPSVDRYSPGYIEINYFRLKEVAKQNKVIHVASNLVQDFIMLHLDIAVSEDNLLIKLSEYI